MGPECLLQRLGGCGFIHLWAFLGYFRRRLVDVDYYIATGGSVYGYLYDTKGQSAIEQALATIFRRLSQQFVQFVDVLTEVGESAFGSSEQDILDPCELWEKIGSPRLERRLKCLGINLQQFTLALGSSPNGKAIQFSQGPQLRSGN